MLSIPMTKPVVHGSSRQPAALLPKIKDKLKEMENDGHLAKVTHPTNNNNNIFYLNMVGFKANIAYGAV